MKFAGPSLVSSSRRRLRASAIFRDLFTPLPSNRQQLIDTMTTLVERGVIGRPELQILQGALKVPEMLVREIMVPRSKMVVISLAESSDEYLPSIISSKHSRFPVVGDTLDEIHGLLLAKDLLPLLNGGGDLNDLSKIVRDAPVVPESKRLDTLLDEFRNTRCHMAVVVDEYGSTSGLVTIEDVLEQIVGRIDDEHDQPESEVQELEDGSLVVDAAIDLDNLSREYNIAIDGDKDEYETLGGLLLASFGKVPDAGDRIRLGNYEYEIQLATERRINKVRIYSLDA